MGTITMNSAVFYFFIANLVFTGLLFVILLLMSLWTPALTFLIAKLKNSPVLYIVNRAQRGRFVTAPTKAEGVMDINGVGTFQLTENSHTITNKGVNLFVGFGEFVSTIPLKYAAVIHSLREVGVKMNSWFDYKAFVDDLNSEAAAEKLKSDPSLLESIKMYIKPYCTVPLHNLMHMFPYNWTPALVESKRENDLALKARAWRSQLSLQTAIIVVVILVGIVIAAVILYKFFGPMGSQTVSNAASSISTI